MQRCGLISFSHHLSIWLTESSCADDYFYVYSCWNQFLVHILVLNLLFVHSPFSVTNCSVHPALSQCFLLIIFALVLETCRCYFRFAVLLVLYLLGAFYLWIFGIVHIQVMRPNHSEEFVFAELNSVNWTVTSKPLVRFLAEVAALSVSVQSYMYFTD